MATAIVVLSSSPSRSPIAITPPTFKQKAMSSSSPALPSPSQLMSEMSSQHSKRNKALLLSEGGVAGFASASSLLRQMRFEGRLEHESSSKRLGLQHGSDAPHSARKATSDASMVVARKEKEEAPLFKRPQVTLDEATITVPVAIEQDTKTQDVVEVKPGQNLAPKKPRKRKSKGEGETEGQTKIKKPNITKFGTSRTGGKSEKSKATVKQTDLESRETFNTLLPSQKEDRKAREEFRDLCLDQAVPLRRQWTPCKDTVQHCSPQGALETSMKTDSKEISKEDTSRVLDFGQLLEYGHAKEDSSQAREAEPRCQGSSGLVFKKTKIDVVKGVPAPPIIEKPKRTKSAKKKPQTITGKATAPFVRVDTTTTSSLLQYFETPVEAADVSNTGQKNGKASETKAKRKTPLKKAPKLQVAKSSQAKIRKQPILLSPESAMKVAKNQGVVFGTSSQLAREESPTFIKDLERAMDESATMSQELGPSILPEGRFRTSSALVLARSRNLWSVASRDFEGTLLEADTVDFTETPKPTKDQVSRRQTPVETDEAGSRVLTKEGETSSDILRVIPDVPQLILAATPALQQKRDQDLLIPRSVAEATLKKRPDNRNPVKNATNSKVDPKQMPNYQGYTDAQLSKEVAAYGFKSIKKRAAMITLLEKCWEAKVSMVLQEVEANSSAPQPGAGHYESAQPSKGSPSKRRGRPPKAAAKIPHVEGSSGESPLRKPRGRPKKDGVAKTTLPKPKSQKKAANVLDTDTMGGLPPPDEIYDSNAPTPSPPRQRPSSKSPRQLHLSPSTKASSKDGDRKAQEDKTQIFDQITKAIKKFPPTHDPKNMTFYEKILIYEPVVLEDLAIWLNNEGLSRVSEDDEVWPGLVKEWCEQNSVCCLWRENLRGGARSRW